MIRSGRDLSRLPLFPPNFPADHRTRADPLLFPEKLSTTAQCVRTPVAGKGIKMTRASYHIRALQTTEER